MYDPRQTTEPKDVWSCSRHYVLRGNIKAVRRFRTLAGECGKMVDGTFGGVDARTVAVSNPASRWLFALADLSDNGGRYFLHGCAIASKEMTLAMNLVDDEETEELSAEIERLKKLGWYCVIADAAHASQRAIQARTCNADTWIKQADVVRGLGYSKNERWRVSRLIDDGELKDNGGVRRDRRVSLQSVMDYCGRNDIAWNE